MPANDQSPKTEIKHRGYKFKLMPEGFEEDNADSYTPGTIYIKLPLPKDGEDNPTKDQWVTYAYLSPEREIKKSKQEEGYNVNNINGLENALRMRSKNNVTGNAAVLDLLENKVQVGNQKNKSVIETIYEKEKANLEPMDPNFKDCWTDFQADDYLLSTWWPRTKSAFFEKKVEKDKLDEAGFLTVAFKGYFTPFVDNPDSLPIFTPRFELPKALRFWDIGKERKFNKLMTQSQKHMTAEFGEAPGNNSGSSTSSKKKAQSSAENPYLSMTLLGILNPLKHISGLMGLSIGLLKKGISYIPGKRLRAGLEGVVTFPFGVVKAMVDLPRYLAPAVIPIRSIPDISVRDVVNFVSSTDKKLGDRKSAASSSALSSTPAVSDHDNTRSINTEATSSTPSSVASSRTSIPPASTLAPSAAAIHSTTANIAQSISDNRNSNGASQSQVNPDPAAGSQPSNAALSLSASAKSSKDRETVLAAEHRIPPKPEPVISRPVMPSPPPKAREFDQSTQAKLLAKHRPSESGTFEPGISRSVNEVKSASPDAKSEIAASAEIHQSGNCPVSRGSIRRN